MGLHLSTGELLGRVKPSNILHHRDLIQLIARLVHLHKQVGDVVGRRFPNNGDFILAEHKRQRQNVFEGRVFREECGEQVYLFGD